MIARLDGAVVLVSNAIPGESVEAEVERVQRGTVWASTTRVLEASPDRRPTIGDVACGGRVLAHVAYERQLTIKADIVRDGLTRIGKLDPPDVVVAPSPRRGYRLRARLHWRNRTLGFYREGTHAVCDPETTGQLADDTVIAIRTLADALASLPRTDVDEVEVSENIAGTERAVHVVLRPDAEPGVLRSIGATAGITGLSCAPVASRRALVLQGSPYVSDAIVVLLGEQPVTVALTRHARSFFQANRFLLPDLIRRVVDSVPATGHVLDLYAGVGIFSAAIAARGRQEVTAVEGDASSARDLRRNAGEGRGISAHHVPVEVFLATKQPRDVEAAIVDPPRTGMSKEAVTGVIQVGAPRVIYVSCDAATLARDARLLVSAGYRVASVHGLDMFPETAHVEVVIVFER
jgi:23S rRNA (uracil1939-C5)-methyltransferase